MVDPALIERAQHGDRDAYAELATASSSRLFGVALRVLRDREAAGDALQAALVAIWRHLPELRDPSAYESWSYRIALNACRTARRRKRPTFRTTDLPDDLAVSDSEVSVANRDELERAFSRLTVDQRYVLVLRYYRDMPVEGIAAALGISTGTVKSRLHGARNAMRAALEAGRRLPVSGEQRA
ncbi:MAG TPA: sigma-70 family RNA polymerase sigma factor [Candidatus Limnocylindrales bacterium]|nr:sigma-70 family RNA polymerase sigma factor [Candidatus Limnocylindrales bacterium]